MKIILIIILLLLCNSVLLFAETDKFVIDLGDSSISDINIDFDNRGFHKSQDYIDIIGSDEDFKFYINTANGNLYHQRIDYFAEDVGLPIRIAFTYNSGSSFKGRFGNHWQLNYNLRYANNNLNNHKIVVYPDDRTSLYLFNNSDSSYNPYKYSFDKFYSNNDGNYNFEFLDDNLTGKTKNLKSIFSIEGHHYVNSISDAYGNTATMSYSEDKFLKTVNFPSGKNIILEYHLGLLHKIILPGGKEISYFYNIDANLTSVHLPSERYYLYKYDECGNLTNISNEHKEIVISYDDNSQVSGLLNNYDDLVYVINYDTIGRRTTLKTPNKSIKIYKYDSLKRSIEYSYGDFVQNKSWNSQNLLSLQKDAKGNQTNYYYDSLGNISKIVYPDDSFEKFDWGNGGKELTFIKRNGAASSYYFDDAKHLRKYISSHGKLIDIIRYSQGAISDILYEDGPSISFLRDNLSRIRFITIDDKLQLKIAYNFDDELSDITDIFNQSTHFTYDQDDRLVSILYPNNSIYAVLYQDNVRRAIVKKRNGSSLEFTFDEIGRLQTIKDEMGDISEFSYNQADLFTLTLGNRFHTFKYDLNRKIKKFVYNNKELFFDYDSNNLLSSILSNGLSYSFKYDDFNNLSEIKDPKGLTKKYDYNNDGLISSYTNANNRITLFYYDNNSRLVRKTIGGISVFYDYSNDNSISINLNNLSNITYHYNYFGQLKSKVSSDIGTFQYHYDASGNLIEILNPLYLPTKLTYDNSYNVSNILLSNSYNVSFKYLQSDYLSEILDNNGFGTKLEYDAKNRITSIIDENGSNRDYSWDTFNNLSAFKSKNANKYAFSYDYENISIRYPDNSLQTINFSTLFNNLFINSVRNTDNSSIRIFYDNNGNTSKIVDDYTKSLTLNYNNINMPSDFANGVNEYFVYTYDFLGRLINIKNPENNDKTFFYNTLSKISTLTDFSGLLYQYSYTDFNKISSIVSQNFEMKFIYDNDKNLISYRDYDSDLLFFKYKDNEISGIFNSNGDSLIFTYDNKNRLSSKTNEDGVKFYYTYTPNDLLNKVTNSTGNVLNFGRDKQGNILNIAIDNKTIGTFKYNNFNTFTSVTSIDTALTFSYNASGNLVQLNSSNGSAYQFNYDILGRKTSIIYPDDKRESFKYDTKGNILEATSIDGQVSNYNFNYKNKLTKAKWSRIDSLLIKYDNDGNIAEIKEPNSTFIEFLWSAGNRLRRFNFFESAWVDIKSTSMQNNNIKIRLQFSNGDTLAYLTDPEMRFLGLDIEDFPQNNYSKTGINLSNYQTNTSSDLFHLENAGLSLGKYKWINNGFDSLSVHYQGNSLVPSFLKNEFEEFSIKYTNSYKFKELWSSSVKINAANYNAYGLLSDITLLDSTYLAFAYNNYGLLRSMNMNQNWQILLLYNNSNNLSSVFDNLGNSFSLLYDNKNNLRTISKLDNAKLDFLYDTFNNLIILKNERYEESAFKYNKQNLMAEAEYPDLSESMITYNPYFSTSTAANNDFLKRNITMSSSLYDRNKLFTINFDEGINYSLRKFSNSSLTLNAIVLREMVTDNSNFLEFKISGNQSVKYFKLGSEVTFELLNGNSYTIDNIDNYTERHKFIAANGLTISDMIIKYTSNSKIKSIEIDNSPKLQSQYDNSNRLISYQINATTPINLEHYPDGRISQVASNDSIIIKSYDANNRLVRSGNFYLSYDMKGNLISKSINSDTTFFVYDYNNALIGIVEASDDTTFLLYTPRMSLIGISGADTTYFMPYDDNAFTSFPHFSAKISSSGETETVFDSYSIDGVRFTYSHNISTNEYKYYILSRDNSTLAFIDNFGNFQSSIENLTPLGEVHDYDNLSEFTTYNNMFFILQLKLFYDGKRFYDPDINQFYQEKNYTTNDPFNPYSSKANDVAHQNKYYHLDLDAILPLINPFDNRFTKIEAEANPFKIIEEEILLHFNNFSKYSLKTINKFKTPVFDEQSIQVTAPESMIFDDLNKSNFKLTLKLPESLLDTLLLNNKVRIVSDKIKTKPNGDEFEIIKGYIALSDIPQESIISKVIDDLIAIPKPYIINFTNIYNESRIEPDLDEIEKFIAVNNPFRTILEDNMYNFRKDQFSELHKIYNFLPIIEQSNFEISDILSLTRSVSQLDSEIINPSKFLDKKSLLAEIILRNNISNFITESLIISPIDMFPGRTHYTKKYLTLPYSNESENNLPNLNIRKIKLKFDLNKNN